MLLRYGLVCIQQHKLSRVILYMETKQHLIAAKVERLQELQVDLDRIHQEQSTLLSELVQLTSAVAAYTLSPPTKMCVGSQVDSTIGHTEDKSTTSDQLHTPRPSPTRSITTPTKNGQTKPQLQVGDHIYIKNKISHSERPNAADRAGIITAIARQPKQQVFFTTYTGEETWCSPLNIRHLSKEEKTQLRESQRDE